MAKTRRGSAVRRQQVVLKPDAGCHGKGMTLVQTEAQAQAALRDLGVIGRGDGRERVGVRERPENRGADALVSDPFLIDGESSTCASERRW